MVFSTFTSPSSYTTPRFDPNTASLSHSAINASYLSKFNINIFDFGYLHVFRSYEHMWLFVQALSQMRAFWGRVGTQCEMTASGTSRHRK